MRERNPIDDFSLIIIPSFHVEQDLWPTSLDRIDRNHTVGWESMHFRKVMIETNFHGGQISMEHLFRLKCMGKLEWQSITAECGQSISQTEAISAMLRSRQKMDRCRS
jgi:hypothetical protein